MKIIGCDNHARESVADSLLLSDIPDALKAWAQAICDRRNARLGDFPGTYYRIVPDHYRLWRGMEELV